VALAAQRYIYVCHSHRAKTFCTVANVLKSIAAIYVVAGASQATRFFEYQFHPVEVLSLSGEENKTVVGCYRQFIPFVKNNIDMYHRYEYIYIT